MKTNLIRHIHSHFYSCSAIMMVVMILMAAVMDCRGAVRSDKPLVPFSGNTPEDMFDRASRLQESESLDSALLYYSWLVESHRNTDKEDTRLLVGAALSEMGQLYYTRYNDYLSAYRCLEEAEIIFKDSGDTISYATVLLNLGNLFNMYDYIFPTGGDTSGARARNLYDMSLDLASEAGAWDLVCSAYINRMMLDLPFSIDGKQNEKIRRLLADSLLNGAEDFRLTRALYEGTEALSRQKYNLAMKVFMSMRDSIGLTEPREKHMADLCLSAVHLKQGERGKAISSLMSIISPKNNINDIDVHMEVYDLLSRIYDLDDNREQAAFYRIKYHEAKDSLTKDIVELEPTRLGIELDRVKAHALKVDAEKKISNIILAGVIILLIVLSVVAFIIVRKNRDLRIKNRVIFERTQSLLAEASHTQVDNTPLDGLQEESFDMEAEQVIAPDEKKPEKYRDSSMTDETRRTLLEKIEKALANTDKICDKNFTMRQLTEIAESNTSYISRVINEHYGMTFGNLLNKLRVQEACRRMGDEENYGHLTIDAISEEVGFNTRSTFTKAFRQHIGMLPSEYIKLLKSSR